MFDATPDDWEHARLADIANIAMGETLLSKSLNGRGVPVFSANTDDAPWGYTDQNRKTLKRGTLVIGARGSIGFPRLPPYDAFTCTQTTISVEPDGLKADSEFLHNALRAIDIKGMAAQQAVPMLTIGMLGPVIVVLPPLDEQRRIAEVLRSLDATIAQNAAVIATSEDTIEMLATTLAEASGDTLCVEDFGRVVTGRTPAPSKAELWGGSLPFITPGDLSDGVISVDSAARHLHADTAHGGKVLPAGSVLVTCIGSTIGKAAIARSACATNQQINAVCCDPAISGYVYLACIALYGEITANAGRQAVPIINKSTFARLPVAHREREEMIEISSLVDGLDSQMRGARAAIDVLGRVRDQVAADLLSGRVRVPA